MNRTVAWAVIGAALGIGIIVGQTFARNVAPVTELGVTCLVLAEAESAGHLTPQKRADLLARLARSPDLAGKEREIASMLRTGCPNLFGSKR